MNPSAPSPVELDAETLAAAEAGDALAEAVDPLRGGDAAIALLLQGGVIVAGCLLALALGGSWLFDLPLGDKALPLDQLFSGTQQPLARLGQLGLLTLAITPLARVTLAARLFARAGERRQAWVAIGVLGLLVLALLLGAAEA